MPEAAVRDFLPVGKLAIEIIVGIGAFAVNKNAEKGEQTAGEHENDRIGDERGISRFKSVPHVVVTRDFPGKIGGGIRFGIIAFLRAYGGIERIMRSEQDGGGTLFYVSRGIVPNAVAPPVRKRHPRRYLKNKWRA